MRPVFETFVLMLLSILVGCSSGGGGSQPILPDENVTASELTGDSEVNRTSENNHYLFLYNLIYVDPDNPDGPKVEVIPVRLGELHINILKFLEVGPCTNCFKIVGFDFPEPGILDVDIEITHPFDELIFTVFDVRGIMMFDGTHTFPASGLTMSDYSMGDGALLNAEGYTQLYNGSTLGAAGDFFSYFKGKFATETVPDADLNGFLRHITDDPANTRNALYAADSVTQTYSLGLPAGEFVFGYAVDASWDIPDVDPVTDPMTDFPDTANSLEPWKVEITEEPIDDGLTDEGGETKLLIDVYDWQGKETCHDPIVECPELFNDTLTATWLEDSPVYSRYEVTVPNANLADVGDYTCLISIEAIENDPVGTWWLDLTAYQLQMLTVTEKVTENPVAVATAAPNPQTAGLPVYFSGSDSYDPDGGDIQLYEWDWNNDGSYDTTGSEADNMWPSVGTYLVQLRVTDDEGETDELDEPLEIVITYIEVISPNGGEMFIVGTAEEILWSSESVTGQVKIEYTTGDSEPPIEIIAATDNDGAFMWDPIPNTPTIGARVIITSIDDPAIWDQSDDQFTIAEEPSLTVLNPNGGEVFVIGAKEEISWSSVNVTGQVKIEYTTKDGKLPIEIIAATDNDGTFIWVPSKPTTTDARVIIKSIDDPAIWDQSDDQFTIAEEPSLTVLDPNGGETLYGDESFEIQWEWTGDITSVYIFYSTDSGANYDGAVVVGADCNGSYMWDPIPGIDTTQARIKIIDAENAATFDESDEDFTISYIIPGDGDLIWANRAGGTDEDYIRGITTFPDDSTVVTGAFEGSATFGPNEINETVLVSAGGKDIFVARYNPDGTLAWATRAGGTEDDQGYGITVLSYTPLVVTGYFKGTATFGEGETYETVLVSAGGLDIFVAKYNPNGFLTWAKRAGGTLTDVGCGITTRSDNTTVVTGYFNGKATFGEGEAFETDLVSGGESDIFVARYRDDSLLEWAKRAGGTDYAYGKKITTLSDDSTVVTGYFRGTATFGDGEANETILVSDGDDYDIVMARYNVTGTLVWAKRAGGAYQDTGQGLTTLSDSSIMLTGDFRNTATFGEGEANETILVSDGTTDIFVARYYPNGTLVWAKRAGGLMYSGGRGITALSDDSTVVTGHFHESATFGEGEANETFLVSYGLTDVFVARYNTDGTLAWAKHSGGTSMDCGYGITTLSDDSTVVTGYFKDTATFGGGEPNETF